MLPVKLNLLPPVSRFFDDDWNGLFDWNNRKLNAQPSTLPSVNIQESSDHYFLEMAAPGMRKEDFEIKLHNNRLTIRSEVKHEQQKSEPNYSRQEFSYKFFERSFNLNQDFVDESKIKAKYEAGMLKLTIPKKEEVKVRPAQTIKIL